MDIISLTPNSPYCKAFENDMMLNFAWISDLSGCYFHGILKDGVLAARAAWQLDPPWCNEKGVVGIVSIETLHKFRRQGNAQLLVDFIRNKYPERAVVFEVNNPFSYQFWKRYQPVSLGRGRGHASLFKISPLRPISNAV